jgi:hypothetical protein
MHSTVDLIEAGEKNENRTKQLLVFWYLTVIRS